MDTPAGFFVSAHQSLARALCAALNHLLASEPQARDKLVAHQGKSLRLEAALLPPLLLTITPEYLLAPAADDASPTLTLSIDAAKAANLAAQGRDVAGAVTIAGDAEFASAMGWLASHLRWEFEEDAAKLVGDAAAYQLGQLIRGAGSTIKKSAQDTEVMLKRGFAESGAPLAHQRAFEPLRKAVSALRDDTARLEKRLELLERQQSQIKVSS